MSLSRLPAMWRMRQRLYSAPIGDVRAAVRAEFTRLGLGEQIRSRPRIAITGGSRGIDRIAEATAALVVAVREAGGDPFLVPSMGSHGGATAEGQVELLASLGVTENSMCAPIRSAMDVEELGTTPEGIPVYLDRNAAAADGILVLNRIKRHTDFTGPTESGLLKMIAIGLGKRRQAEAVHAYGEKGQREFIAPIARVSLAKAPILAGFALADDGYHRLSRVVGVLPNEMERTEERILRWTKRVEPRIPFDDIDLLIVDSIGKNLSGCGMDTKVIGRMRIPSVPELKRPRVRVLIARDLAPESHGNGVGIGLADIVTRRLADQIDWQVTNTNVWTSSFLERSKVGIVASDDREALDVAVYLLRNRRPEDLRIVRIPDTLHLSEMEISGPLLAEARTLAGAEMLPDHCPLPGADCADDA